VKLKGYMDILLVAVGILVLIAYTLESVSIQDAYPYAWLLPFGIVLFALGAYLVNHSHE